MNLVSECGTVPTEALRLTRTSDGMTPWLKRLHLVVTIGGSFAGIAIALIPLLTNGQAGSGARVPALLCLAFYIYGLVVGIRLSERGPSRPALLWFYGIQVPRVSSSHFAFGIAAGAHANIGFLGDRLYYHWQIGADYYIAIGSPASFGLGVNLFALALFSSVIRSMESSNALEREGDE